MTVPCPAHPAQLTPDEARALALELLARAEGASEDDALELVRLIEAIRNDVAGVRTQVERLEQALSDRTTTPQNASESTLSARR